MTDERRCSQGALRMLYPLRGGTTMVTIETIATVSEDGTITAKAPDFVTRGKHKAVIVLEDAAVQPSGARRGFPNMAAFRDRLGVPVHPGNTIVEMREDERP